LFDTFWSVFCFGIALIWNITEEKMTVNGIDLVVLAILSTTAIVLVGFAAKAYCLLKYDWNQRHSLLESKQEPPADEKDTLSS
jgi:hypothetical protein